MSETITHAAIRYQGKIWLGRRHYLIRDEVVSATNQPMRGEEQGFYTSTGRFVDREEAARIALAAGQIEKLRWGKTRLFSEEIIP